MKNDRNIVYVGTLQDLGRPYSMLFVDREDRQLYLSVRISEGSDNHFLLTSVSASEIEDYLNESIGLISIVDRKPHYVVSINHNKIQIEKEEQSRFEPTEKMKKMDRFDPELCEDEIWLEVFLNRLINNQPIEIN